MMKRTNLKKVKKFQIECKPFSKKKTWQVME